MNIVLSKLDKYGLQKERNKVCSIREMQVTDKKSACYRILIMILMIIFNIIIITATTIIIIIIIWQGIN